ncbi:MAG: fructose-1,6-bisphosphatase [Sphingobacterium sp.]|nr:fructose-1,6-bisphosphatase [Sphingobacterium sp.]
MLPLGSPQGTKEIEGGDMADQADPSPIITIERHILDEQAFHPEATGTLTNILYDLALAGKVIASKTTRAGLAEILGRTGDINVQGETVMKLDRFADLTITRLTDHTGRLAGLASEENEKFLPIPDQYPMGKYLLVFDPLDGSSNVDFNMPVGTIFGIYRRVKESGPVDESEFFQPGRNLVAAGLHRLRDEHDVRLHGRARRPRLHPRPVGRRVPAVPPEHHHPQGQVFQRQPRLPDVLEPGRPALHGIPAGPRGRHQGPVAALHRDARLRFPPQPPRGRRLLLPGRLEGPQDADRQAASSLRGRAARLHRRAGRRLRVRTAGGPSSTSRRHRSTSGRPSSSATRSW